MATEPLDRLHRVWGLIVLRGVAAILFGVLAFVWPGITLAALVLVWGAYGVLDGLCALIASLRLEDGKPMWTLALVGLLGIAAGLLTLMWPQLTAAVLLLIIAGWAVAMGVFQLAAAIRFRKWISNEWLLALSGLLSIAFGMLLLARPGASAVALVWVIGWFAFLFGGLLVMFGLRIKGVVNRIVPLEPPRETG
jgi:uncharacterized membrane protein HdeD (DUF308 family)